MAHSEHLELANRIVAAEASAAMEAAAVRLSALQGAVRFDAATPTTAAPQHTPSMVATDPAWEAIQRNKSSFKRLLAEGFACGFSANSYFRNSDLNPGDVYIPPGIRASLDAAITASESDIAAFRRAATWINHVEFQEMVASGQAVQSSITPIVDRVGSSQQRRNRVKVSISEMQRAGVDMVVVKDGVVHGASRAGMPLSKAALDQQRFLEVQIAASITQWFESIGSIQRTQADALMMQVFDRGAAVK